MRRPAMKVSDLIEKLQEADPESVVHVMDDSGYQADWGLVDGEWVPIKVVMMSVSTGQVYLQYK